MSVIHTISAQCFPACPMSMHVKGMGRALYAYPSTVFGVQKYHFLEICENIGGNVKMSAIWCISGLKIRILNIHI